MSTYLVSIGEDTKNPKTSLFISSFRFMFVIYNLHLHNKHLQLNSNDSNRFPSPSLTNIQISMNCQSKRIEVVDVTFLYSAHPFAGH